MSRNDITGDKIATKPASDAYRDGWAGIFDKPSKCEDCDGTGKDGDKPCKVCAPTEDGPGDDGRGDE